MKLFLSHIITRTTAAIGFSISLFKCQIIARQFMPCFTMRFCGILRRYPVAPQNIRVIRDLLNVYRIYTASISAKVIAHVLDVRQFYKEMIENAVGWVLDAINHKSSVSASHETTLPFPTRHSLIKTFGTDFDFRKKAGKKSGVGSFSDNIVSSHSSLQFRLFWSGSESVERTF